MASPLTNHEVMILLWTKPLSQSKNMEKIMRISNK